MRRAIAPFLRSNSILPTNKISHPIYGPEHWAIAESLGKFIEERVNLRVDEWERAKQFPARELFPQFAKFGVFGANKPKGDKKIEKGNISQNIQNMAVWAWISAIHWPLPKHWAIVPVGVFQWQFAVN